MSTAHSDLPTTALPAYVLAGATDAVHALNLHRLRVPLGDDELASLTHDMIPPMGACNTFDAPAAAVR